MIPINFYHFSRIIWLQVTLLAITFSTSRWIFLFLTGNHEVMLNMPFDLLEAIFLGLRFDLRAATIACAPLFLFGLSVLPTKHYTFFKKSIPTYSFIIYFLAVSLSIGNYYYFKTYNNHFDIFVFGFIEDDTVNVIACMWSDYPIVLSFIATLLITMLLTRIVNNASNRLSKKHMKNKAWYLIALSLTCFILGYFYFARGSLGTFPLKQYHANISTYEVFNKSTPNAFLALDWAYKKHKKDGKFAQVPKAKLQQQLKKVLDRDSAVSSTLKNDLLANSPPNVVLALMESMGTNLLEEDRADRNDLLGSLRQPFEDDFLFTRFVSGADNTIGSLVMMLFHSNFSRISHGKAQNKSLSGSAFLPYQVAGYKVVYITGGSPTWRNMNQYLLHQGVDEFYSQTDIEKVYPKASEYAGAWGVPDVFTFKFAKNILEQSQQPVMIVLLTQTNHSPYQTPDDYQPKPISVSDHAMSKLSMTEKKSRKVFEIYQYSTNALGDFIQDIKKTEGNTVIAATGDHRVRSYSIDYPQDLGIAYSVPFYLHVPNHILASIPHRYDNLRVGSHRDIFPTLYSYSLSGSKYMSLGGRNLLAAIDAKTAKGFNETVTLTKEGVICVSSPELIYPWLNDSSLQVSTISKKHGQKDFLKEYKQLQTLFINAQVEGVMP